MRHIQRLNTVILLSGLLVSGAACAHHPGTAAPAEVQPQTAPVTVNVTNNYASAMEIYVIGSGTSYHMGSVAPGIPRSFELRPGMIAAGGRVRFVAQASGAGPRYQSEEVVLRPGDVVDFDLMTNLVGSRATVRP